jgi:hypothetical protein
VALQQELALQKHLLKGHQQQDHNDGPEGHVPDLISALHQLHQQALEEFLDLILQAELPHFFHSSLLQ